MRDILGFAVAVLVGLITLAFQPRTPHWWYGIIISSAVAIVTACHLIWRSIPERISGHLGPATWSPDGTIVGGETRAILAIVFVCILVGSGYVAVHWPINFRPISFLQSEPRENPPDPEAPILSRLNHYILDCNVPPPPPSKTVTDSLWELQDYKQKLDVIGDAIGYTFTMVTIRGGVRIEAEAVTEEAKQRIPLLSKAEVTKVTLEVRRVNKTELVSVFVKLPPEYEFYGAIPPNPAASDSMAVVHTVERFLGWPTDTCRIV